ncbi:U-box domain-containing protein 9 [Ananas comosus]|uniref:RING-type E3 ubiquitin transferase n=1 Tax=Ananas comosus TaxID=4615 RepID=A0A199VYN4_ANACO|nr:U-box domain-containing protein 9 [Ananas comosus]
MAKSGAAAVAAAVEDAELRRELRRLVRAIAEDNEVPVATYEEAARVLSALRELRFGAINGDSNGKERRKEEGEREVESLEIPKRFLCPISSELMRDPVVVASGQTYDRPFIEEWLNSGNRICPQSQQVLANTILTPNLVIRSMISEWCTDHGLIPPQLKIEEDGLLRTKNERSSFNDLLNVISLPSSSVFEQKKAVRELRLLTKLSRSFRTIVVENPSSFCQLLSILSSPNLHRDREVEEDMVTTILNLSIDDDNKKIVGENPRVIPLLIEALQFGTMEARGNSAAALFTLSALDSNKLRIGEMGVMKPLVDLLENGNPNAKKDAASAIFNLCMAHENRVRAVKGGAIGASLKSIEDQSLVDESLAILALLSNDQDAVEEISERRGVSCLLRMIRQNSCPHNKENAVVVLFAICMYDRTKLTEIGEEERLNGTVSWMVRHGTSRGRRKASGILERLKRISTHSMHHSC